MRHWSLKFFSHRRRPLKEPTFIPKSGAGSSAKPFLPGLGTRGSFAVMKYVPKKTTDEALIQEFLKNGGKVSVGKTKPLPSELGLSRNVWNYKLTKEEKAARDKK